MTDDRRRTFSRYAVNNMPFLDVIILQNGGSMPAQATEHASPKPKLNHQIDAEA